MRKSLSLLIAFVLLFLQAASAVAWDCSSCGASGNDGNFCVNCAAPSPAPAAGGVWTCPSCGRVDNTGKFCPDCASPSPAPASTNWTCPSCGEKSNSGKFCISCAQPSPAPGGQRTGETYLASYPVYRSWNDIGNDLPNLVSANISGGKAVFTFDKSFPKGSDIYFGYSDSSDQSQSVS